LEEVPRPDLIVTGCVAVDREGNRLGKGGGYGDNEITLFKSNFGNIPVVTTVHDTQIVDEVPTGKGDVKVDIIVTPKTVIRISSTSPLA
jgi:5-formyltetrahydrofolate cyclo-ligase